MLGRAVGGVPGAVGLVADVLAQGALAQAQAYMQERKQFGKSLASFQATQFKLADMETETQAARMMLYNAAQELDAKTPMEYIQLHVTKPPIPLDARVPGKRFPQGLGEAIAKALEKKPDDRYASASEFADALKPFAFGRSFER